MTKYQKYKLIMLAIFGMLFLLIMYNNSSIGRYILQEDWAFIFDTKTGTIYEPNLGKIELDEYIKYKKKK
ncbi:hypothetical protein [Algibacter mikhailovii]|uniref:Uncharacterized protein n=1 Tax=Algibacter mikhailovii TaxID=425498 RepID=A0A918V5T0_9FLAO|nr:hypothetical protein [Algibacter mikhailovii]GGZ72466.1 hypothetical protein GCM10007028_06860 [Algibacter mikhailovii]